MKRAPIKLPNFQYILRLIKYTVFDINALKLLLPLKIATLYIPHEWEHAMDISGVGQSYKGMLHESKSCVRYCCCGKESE